MTVADPEDVPHPPHRRGPAPGPAVRPARPSTIPAHPARTVIKHMSRILVISGSPSAVSRTDGVLSHLVRRFQVGGHEVQQVRLRDLPAGPLLAADVTRPEIAAAVRAVDAADAIVIGSPVFKAAYSGLLKSFLDLLPQFAFRGKSVLPIVTGGSPAHVLAVDYALRPVLASMGPAHIGQGWFVLSEHVQLFPGGGVLLDAKASAPLYEVTDAFLGHLALSTGVPAPVAPPVIDHDRLEVSRVSHPDPLLDPLLADLKVEYGTRYGMDNPHTLLVEVPQSDFDPANRGGFVVLTIDGQPVAGGAIRRKDDETAEVKRVWTSNRHRRQGLARRVMAELELLAADLGYSRIYLTTGPRQPEARDLYLASGYEPQFDVQVDPESIGPLPFVKALHVSGTLPNPVPAIDTVLTGVVR